MKKKIAFLGAGNMGSALIQGALGSGFLRASQVAAYDLDARRLAGLARRFKIRAAASNADAVRGADYVFLCVKPQQMRELLAEIGGAVNGRQCLVSIAAGVRTAAIEGALGRRVPVVRVMPNQPALVRRGMSAVAGGKHATRRHVKFAADLLASVGKAVALPERHLDAVTAVSGSGPAYVFYLTEALQQAARQLGLPADAAGLLARQTVAGAAEMLGGPDQPGELRRKVTSPGGTTEAALRHLERSRWDKIFIEAIKKAKKRSVELSQLYQ